MAYYLNNSYFSPTTPINVVVGKEKNIVKQNSYVEDFYTSWQNFLVKRKNEKESENEETPMLQMW